MCGIAGIIGEGTKNREKALKGMVRAITHRGPDDEGFFSDERVALGMRRLSIIDLKTGKQPISSENERHLIFFNGEIYNYKELRVELERAGQHFKTESDTEIVLRMYELHGKKCLARLRGMFAFAIYDREKGRAFLARDFFGIKPFTEEDIEAHHLAHGGHGGHGSH